MQGGAEDGEVWEVDDGDVGWMRVMGMVGLGAPSGLVAVVGRGWS